MARIVPRELLLASRLGEVYSRNEIHRYHEGDVLVLRANSLGFGIRPVAVVKGYEISENTKEGLYVVEMNSDREGDTMEGRTIEEERHFKWNIEFLFRKVPKGMASNPELFYKGRKINWGEVPY